MNRTHAAMFDQHIHLYEKLPLAATGIAMGLALILLHLPALLRTTATITTLNRLHKATKAGQALLAFNFLWLALLLFDAKGNPLRMELFEFEVMRGILLLACPVVWFVLASMVKENLFARALGMFLIMMAIVPLSAAFLKEPVTRLLIPIWWYPVLTVAMFWVAKPYLFRDWVERFTAHPNFVRATGAFGAVYGALIIICALLFW